MNQPLLTVDTNCRLEGSSPAVRADLRKRLTLVNPVYRDAVRYARWVGKNLKRELRFYGEEGDMISFPRGFGNEAVRICDRHGQRPLIRDLRTSLEPVNLTFHGRLRPYQERAVAAILTRDFGVLQAATGSGKTVMAAAVLAARRQPALVLVHTKELLYQWQERLRTFLRLDPGLIGDGSLNPETVSVGLIHTVRKHLSSLPARFGQIVVDEAHRTPSSMFTEIISRFDCRHMLGLTATPYRRDGLTDLISWYMGDLVHRVSSTELDRQGAVLRPRVIFRQTAFRFPYRNNYQAMLSALTADGDRNRMIVADICRESRENPGTALVVSDRVAHCEELCDLLQKQGVETALLTGRMPAAERNEVAGQVRDGRLRALVATIQLIGEGFDCPGLTSLFLCTPIKFSGRLTQVIGRILRPAEGKEARVYDYVDQVGVLKASARARRQTYDLTFPG